MDRGGIAVNIPVGISDFQKIRENGYYYIDKSGLIAELLKGEPAEVTLITRPRRFGKTLAMGMLADFFDVRKNSEDLFKGLKISEQTELCEKWMNKWPVLFISFKRAAGLNFSDAFYMMRSIIAEACVEHRYLIESDKPDIYDRRAIENVIDLNVNESELKNSLISLTRAMHMYYGKSVIVIIDEYDVPVAKAEENGYYDQMMDMMKDMMQVLKDNRSLCFAVVTGCLRIAKESIFTGTNNFVSDAIMDSQLNEYFGFTQNEVDKLMSDTGTTARTDDMKTWYDGYRFGDAEIYCPWDVMNFIRDLLRDPAAKPLSYWKNSSESANLTFEMTKLLRKTISYHDYREDFYHAFLAGIFTGAGYRVESNKEHGEGRSDVVVYDDVNARVAVFEVKYSKNISDMEILCDFAIEQIDTRMYAKEFEDDYDDVFCYGIVFFRKRCLVKAKGI